MLVALSACHLMNDLLQALLPALYPMLKSGYALGFWQIGLITLTMQATSSLLQPAVGLFADRRPQPYSLAAGMGVTLVGLVYLMLRSRLHALRWFKRSILASIFLTDLFTFYYQQLGAVADLAVDLILLAAFEALIEAEHRRSERREVSAG